MVKAKIKEKKALKKSVKQIKKTTLKADNYDQDNFNLDHLLIDEQLEFLTEMNQVESLELLKSKKVYSELDKLIEGKNSNFEKKEILPRNEIKIRLFKNGKFKTKTTTLSLDNSAHLLDLKQRREKKSKLVRPPRSMVEKFFSQIEKNIMDEPVKMIDQIEQNKFEKKEDYSSNLLKKKRLLKRLDNFGLKLYNKLPKYKKLDYNFTPPKFNQKWLINLRFALNFALIALLLIIPIRGLFFYKYLEETKGQVLGVSEEALSELKTGVEAISELNWQAAGLSFGSASNYFREIKQYTDNFNQSFIDLLKVIPVAGKKISSAEKLVRAGEQFSSVAQELTIILSKSQEIKDLDQALTDDLIVIYNGLDKASNDLNLVITDLMEIDSSIIPKEYREIFTQLQEALPVLNQSLNHSKELFKFSLDILGHASPKRYLFMFQNTNELRPTGGFFGTFALVDLDKGEIVNMEVPSGGTYDLKGYLTEKVISPEPMQLVGSAWNIWDANWWADFPTSAEKIIWFFENSGWPSVDGVIAINSSIIPELLKIVGNIEMPEYGKVLTPDNVVLALQHATLFEYEDNKPKEIISDLMPLLIEKLLSTKSEQTLPIILALNNAFESKDFQFYFTEQSKQETARSFGWTGEMEDTNNDYLMVVNTNIAGGKTDTYIKQEVNHYSYIEDDGSIVNTVSIKRSHQGNLIPVDDANYVFAKNNNINYIRIYVPEGSELLEVTGYMPPNELLFKEIYSSYRLDIDLLKINGVVFTDPKTGVDINNELNKTVFGHWLQVEPGESSTLTFSYKLPFKLDLNKKGIFNLFSNDQVIDYSLLVQKQSGVINNSFNSHLYLPKNYSFDWSNNTLGSNLEINEEDLNFSTDLRTDQYYATLIKKNK